MFDPYSVLLAIATNIPTTYKYIYIRATYDWFGDPGSQKIATTVCLGLYILIKARDSLLKIYFPAGKG